MGLFNEERIVVASSASALMEPNTNAVADAVLYAILSRTSIAQGLVNVGLTGMGIKTDQIRRWAKDNYTLGLSSGGLSTDTVILDDGLVEDTIALDLSLSNGVIVETNVYGAIAFLAIANMFLVNHRR